MCRQQSYLKFCWSQTTFVMHYRINEQQAALPGLTIALLVSGLD